MNSLKKKFGKFAVSSEISRNTRGGYREPVAVSYDGAGGGDSRGICCRWADGYSNSNTICGYENLYSLEGARDYCRSRSSQGCQACYYS